jgi:hypothetical protein
MPLIGAKFPHLLIIELILPFVLLWLFMLYPFCQKVCSTCLLYDFVFGKRKEKKRKEKKRKEKTSCFLTA